MINSLFMLGSSYNRNRKISIAFIIGWLAFMLINSDISLGVTFPIINAITFLSVSILINLIKNKKVNTVLSILSILIWSIVIDVICYFAYPMLVGGQNILAYVFQGILFNARYILPNILAIAAITGIDILISKISSSIKEKVNA